jgi:hypothetical protein
MVLAFIIIFGSLSVIVGLGALILAKSGDLILFAFGTGISALAISLLDSLYFRNKPILSKKIQLVCEVIFAVAIVNFLAFLIVSTLIGRGNYPHSEIIDGHYYLNGFFGKNEVSFIVYIYSIIHAKSLLVTHPLAIIAGWIHFMTGGYGRIRQLPNLLKTASRKSHKVIYKNELPKSRF